MSEQPSTSALSGGNPEKKKKHNYEKKIELHRIRFRDPYYRVYSEMVSDPDRQGYKFYEIPEAATFSGDRGIKVNLVGVYECYLEHECHYLVRHNTQNKTFENPAKVYLEFGLVKDPPVPEDVVELKGLLTCKNGKHIVEVHIVNIIDERVVDKYFNCLRRVKNLALASCTDLPSDLDLQDFLREIESCPMLG